MSSCSVQAIWNQSIVSLQEHIVNSYLSTFPPFQQGKYCNFLAPCNIRLLVWLKSIIYLQENNTIGDTALYRKNIHSFWKVIPWLTICVFFKSLWLVLVRKKKNKLPICNSTICWSLQFGKNWQHLTKNHSAHHGHCLHTLTCREMPVWMENFAVKSSSF